MRCRRAVFGVSWEADSGPRLARQLDWESHILELCWRCMVNPVDSDDDFGLCAECSQGRAEAG